MMNDKKSHEDSKKNSNQVLIIDPKADAKKENSFEKGL